MPHTPRQFRVVYLVFNDTLSPARYYMGQGFKVTETTSEFTAATEMTMQAAIAVLKGRPELYRDGWRVVPKEIR